MSCLDWLVLRCRGGNFFLSGAEPTEVWLREFLVEIVLRSLELSRAMCLEIRIRACIRAAGLVIYGKFNVSVGEH